MRTKHFISISLLLSSFYGKLLTSSLVGKEKYHQIFDSNMHSTNEHTNIYIEVYSNKGTEEKFNIRSYDNKEYLNEIQAFEVKPNNDQVLSLLPNHTALKKLSIAEKKKTLFHSHNELIKRAYSIYRPSNYNLLSII